MPLPLFDNVLVEAVPQRDGPVRTHEGQSPTTAHPSARLSETPFELDDHRPKSHRPPTIARQGSAEHFAWWTAFNRGADGQSPPGVEHDEQIAAYAASGYRVGRLFRPLDVMKETRR